MPTYSSASGVWCRASTGIASVVAFAASAVSFVDPDNRFAVEVYGPHGWTAYTAYPTEQRAWQSVDNLARSATAARVIDMVTGKLLTR
jgi:hypothetical protein